LQPLCPAQTVYAAGPACRDQKSLHQRRRSHGHIKQELFELILDYFAEARAKRKELLANPDHIRQVLASGADKARSKAIVTLDLVRDRVGLKY
jgi:hypothetical protein